LLFCLTLGFCEEDAMTRDEAILLIAKEIADAPSGSVISPQDEAIAKPNKIYWLQLTEPSAWVLLIAGTISNSATEKEVKADNKQPTIEKIFEGKWRDCLSMLSSARQLESAPQYEFIYKGSATIFEIAFHFVEHLLEELRVVAVSSCHPMTLNVMTKSVVGIQGLGRIEDCDMSALRARIQNPEQESKKKFKPINFGARDKERNAFFVRFPVVTGPGLPEFSDFEKLLSRITYEGPTWLDKGIWRCQFFTTELMVMQDGWLLADQTHKIEALEALNSFLACAFLIGSATEPTNASRMGKLTIDADGRPTSWYNYQPLTNSKKQKRREIARETLEKAIEIFPEVIKQQVLAELRLCHAAILQMEDGELLQGFTLAWISIERSISVLWKAALERHGYSGSRLEEMCATDRYTASVQIDMLDLLRVITGEFAGELHSCRKTRNKAAHQGQTPSREQTEKCLKAARDLILLRWTGVEKPNFQLSLGKGNGSQVVTSGEL